MTTETAQLKKVFEKASGHKVRSARLGTGSMRGYIYFRMPYTLEIRDFCKNYYHLQSKKIFGKHSFRGVPIRFLGNTFDDLTWHMKHGYQFIVEISTLKQIEKK